VAKGLAYPKWGTKPYPKSYDARYAVLQAMIAIDLAAALRATSLGLPQILGSNSGDTGYAGARTMFEDFQIGEGRQVSGMCRLLTAWGLDDGLRTADLGSAAGWVFFARRYNGSGYAKNNYHLKLAKAFLKHAAGEQMVLALDPTLTIGSKGERVRNLQADLVALGFDPGPVDGRFGRHTEGAVKLFQPTAGLSATGQADPGTVEALAAAIKAHDDAIAIPTDQVWDRR